MYPSGCKSFFNDTNWIQQFNNWRANYDVTTYEEQQSFYDVISEPFPFQQQFSPESVKEFFRIVARKLDSFSVVELGGWRGELASLMLDIGINYQIRFWRNYEICQRAVKQTFCRSRRYSAIVPRKPFWELEHQKDYYEVFVASHVLEHIKKREVTLLLECLQKIESLRFLYLDIPIPQSCTNNLWTNYFGCHILEIGWSQLESLVREFGFSLLKKSSESIRIYKR